MTTSIYLQADNIHKRFGNNEVLKGVSVTAQAGDVISMIGSSGSGKSTFLRCLNLLEQPHAGAHRARWREAGPGCAIATAR